MEPGSRTDDPAEQTPQRLANAIGVLIALLTLAIPLFAISHFSSANEETWHPTPRLLVGAGD